jgi:UDP-glucose 4-epimerase
MSRILVTGGAGYIGSHMCWELVGRGHEVLVIDDLSTGHEQALPPGTTLLRGQVGAPEIAAALAHEHARSPLAGAMHFAAKARVDESVRFPDLYFEHNTQQTLRLAQQLRELKVPWFMLSSTAAVYGNTSGELIREDHPVAPASPYGESKLRAELGLRDWAASGGERVAILRYFNVAGADPEMRTGQSTPQATHLIKLAAQTVVAFERGQASGASSSVSPTMQIHGTDYPTHDGTCLRDYVHVSDIAGAHLAVMESLMNSTTSSRDARVFNVGYGQPYSVREVLACMQDVSGVKFPIVEGPRREGDVVRVACDSRRLQAETGWAPRFADLKLICQTALAWERRLAARTL